MGERIGQCFREPEIVGHIWFGLPNDLGRPIRREVDGPFQGRSQVRGEPEDGGKNYELGVEDGSSETGSICLILKATVRFLLFQQMAPLILPVMNYASYQVRVTGLETGEHLIY